MNENNYLVILAGGAGSRFWPISSEELPKQFLDILGCGRTLIQLTLERFNGLIPKENVWVVTAEKYREIVMEQLPEIPSSNILCEPCRRNTAPCICYVSWKIKKLNTKANIVVSPSDHLVVDIQAFQSAIDDSLSFAAETDAVVTLGLKPTRPETGYGYIKADLTYSSSRKHNIFRVDEFKEKPTLEVAKEYIQSPNYLWNSGIFIWNVNTIINAFRVYEPEVSSIFEGLMPYYGTDKEQNKIDESYPQCKNISVDYAILEKAEEIFVFPASFSWSDLGTWNSLREQSDMDKYGNVCIGDNIKLYDTYNTIVHTCNKKEVIVEGLDGYVVAEKEGKLLVCRLSEEQRIKLFH
ncbi:mannose-1-phosphate guanylyltransferase [Prevotellamassilia timonensis]|jgi:mannose-1-phosphate guanylyltransferase|uniref:mannose-1-phosphate guanylyltransferase n=1 Tax=Prevotellamassilia timonensis TaxID=1852370 RepID=UPI0008DA1EDD|nr:mannose-1-phosphate guanylyltransferase [Prevotellamassilia timonensis]